MRRKIFAALLVLGVSGQAMAQDPAANLTNALGNLLPNLTNTTESLLALQITETTVSLNDTVTDLTGDLTAGTPLAPLAGNTDSLMILVTPQTRTIDEILAGEQGLDDLAADLQSLATFDPGLLLTLVQGTMRDPSSTALNPQTVLLIVQSLVPLEGLDSLGGLDPVGLLTGIAGGQAVSPLDLAVVTSLLSGGSGGSPLDALPLGSLLSLSGGGVGGGLPAGDLPLPVDALDLGTLTGLLSGASLPGL